MAADDEQAPDADDLTEPAGADEQSHGEASEPDGPPSDVAEAVVSEPDASEPDMLEPTAPEPALSEPALSAPETSEPDVTEAGVAEPGTADQDVPDGEAVDDAAAPDDASSGHSHEQAAAGPAADDAPPTTSGWATLGKALRFRSSRAQLLAGLLCAVLGFALVVQVRQNNEASLSDLSQADLVRILDETTTRGDSLATEVNDLRRERDELVSGSDRRQAALDALRRSAETQGILAGRLPAEGPGVVVTLTEPNGQITPATMLNMLEELRNAGAEAIDLNGLRITASSAFAGIPGAVTLDDTKVVAPFVWKAIGDPDTIATALQIPGGALAAVRNNGGDGSLDRREKIAVTSLRVLPTPEYAKPVPASDS